ncbi:uncharacterized protein SOCG_03888 [Schizosaccharomyces octosporus yFS286]|uniref:Uncharacterized protein n=1 Tax=Schizosaccharomyces octosporus (strain yFS286) TaxID=483514 RepID=S9RCX3_SCHOY|nr:uncharacterized protein SOCG_03888 [Schizosaccharomyces octosporus yFS286]EPX71954.1 hypothetical protein SOCG_03888 [Schizosaccharomyces octosporus yFS286]
MSSRTWPLAYRSPLGYAYKLYLEGNLASSLHILKTYFQEGYPKEEDFDSACNLYLQVSSELNNSWQETVEWLNLVHNGTIPNSLLHELIIIYSSKKTWESSKQVAEFLSLVISSKNEVFIDSRGYQVEEQLVKLACEWNLFALAKSLLVSPKRKKEEELLNYISEKDLQNKLKQSLSPDMLPRNDATNKGDTFTLKGFTNIITKLFSQLSAKIGLLRNIPTWFPRYYNLLFIFFALVTILFKIKGVFFET